MSETSRWRRLTSWLRKSPVRALPAPETAPMPEPVYLRPEEEMWLGALVDDVGEGRRLEDIAGSDFWERIEALWKHGHERLAIEWLEKFVAAPATPAPARLAVRIRLVELCEQQRDLGLALSHLEVLVEHDGHDGHDEHALRSHYLLGEHYRRQGDETRALRHYEAVLARDMRYPNVRRRLERLRALRGRLAPAAMGETIAGAEAGVTSGTRYHLVRELGRGATGVVYLARDAELERDVAVKLLHPHLASANRAAQCARFFEEARISASLRHPNIMAVLDLDERTRRIVIELAAGATLRDVLCERGPRPLRRALERHSQILSALAAAHRRGIVHRDLKPGNLMFRRDADEPGAEIILGDFGVAHLPDAQGATNAEAAKAKKPAEALGTLAYMSPEQRRGEGTDPRTDLFAAAVVLYEMLTCRYPWSREQLLAGGRKRGDFRLPAGVTSGTSAEFVHRLQTHLDALGDPDAHSRPDTAQALADARDLRDLAIVETG